MAGEPAAARRHRRERIGCGRLRRRRHDLDAVDHDGRLRRGRRGGWRCAGGDRRPRLHRRRRGGRQRRDGDRGPGRGGGRCRHGARGWVAGGLHRSRRANRHGQTAGPARCGGRNGLVDDERRQRCSQLRRGRGRLSRTGRRLTRGWRDRVGSRSDGLGVPLRGPGLRRRLCSLSARRRRGARGLERWRGRLPWLELCAHGLRRRRRRSRRGPDGSHTAREPRCGGQRREHHLCEVGASPPDGRTRRTRYEPRRAAGGSGHDPSATSPASVPRRPSSRASISARLQW